MSQAAAADGRSSIRVPLPLVLLLPAGVLFVVFFLFPLGVLVINSFHDYSRLAGIIPEFTLKNYVKIASDSSTSRSPGARCGWRS